MNTEVTVVDIPSLSVLTKQERGFWLGPLTRREVLVLCPDIHVTRAPYVFAPSAHTLSARPLIPDAESLTSAEQERTGKSRYGPQMNPLWTADEPNRTPEQPTRSLGFRSDWGQMDRNGPQYPPKRPVPQPQPEQK